MFAFQMLVWMAQFYITTQYQQLNEVLRRSVQDTIVALDQCRGNR